MSEFSEKLKTDYPKAHERFIGWYTEQEIEGNRVWFHEMDFRCQYYFFLDYIYHKDPNLMSQITVRGSFSELGKRLTAEKITDAFFIFENRLNRVETGFALDENDKA